MDAGPDDVRSSAGLGPISPELVLVDPALAEQARRLLPDRPEWPPRRPPRPAVATAAAAVAAPEAAAVAAPEVAVEPVGPPPSRRRGRTVVLAGLVFAAGAASGNFLAERNVPSSGVTFEAQVSAARTPSTRTQPAKPKPSRTRSTRTTRRPALRPPAVFKQSRPRPSRRQATKPARRRSARARRVTWAPNVLGVTAQVAGAGVTIGWRRPPNSGGVVVVRAGSVRAGSVVVFRGRGTSYRDSSPRPCTAYRYTIVNYDRRGNRSTGVPTSVVTQGCG